MAELSYSDMQRAVQDGVRNLQNDLQRVSSTLTTVSQQAERIEGVEMALRDLQRSALTLQNTLVSMRTVASHPVDPRIAQVAADMHDLKIRFAVIEKFAAQMSEYVQARYDEDQEDRQYRAA